MKRIASLGFLAPLLAAAILSGCGTVGGWDQGRYPNRYPDRNPDGRYDDRVDNLQGTVASVNTRERLIYVDRAGLDDRYQLRNDDRSDRGGNMVDTVAISYDDSTLVRYQGRSFRPGDLERGDRIQASIERNGDYLLAQQIDVLYDVSSGTGGPGGSGGSGGGYDNGGYDNRNGGYTTDLRGTIRTVDTRNRTLEIDRSQYDNRFNSDSGRYNDPGNGYGTVLVRYDTGTTVRFQGRDYSPENLERGDVVQIQARDDNGRLTAQRIDVLGENGRSSRY
jgi:hypothetical protein